MKAILFKERCCEIDSNILSRLINFVNSQLKKGVCRKLKVMKTFSNEIMLRKLCWKSRFSLRNFADINILRPSILKATSHQQLLFCGLIVFSNEESKIEMSAVSQRIGCIKVDEKNRIIITAVGKHWRWSRDRIWLFLESSELWKWISLNRELCTTEKEKNNLRVRFPQKHRKIAIMCCCWSFWAML